MKIKTLPELWPLHDILFDSQKMAQSYTCTTPIRKPNLEYMRKARRRLQSWNRRMARAELRTKERLWFCALPDSPTSLSETPSTTERGEGDFDHGVFIDRANRRDRLLQTGSSTTRQSWANGSLSQTDQSWQGPWEYFDWEHCQDLWDTSEYHNWRWLP